MRVDRCVGRFPLATMGTVRGLDELVRDLIAQRYGARGRRALARETERSPHGGVSHTTISRIAAGSLRRPGEDTLRSLAWALGGTDEQRDGILTQLRTAAGLTAQEPPPLSWPAGVDQLTDRQRRALQRVVNTTVAAFLDEQ